MSATERLRLSKVKTARSKKAECQIFKQLKKNSKSNY